MTTVMIKDTPVTAGMSDRVRRLRDQQLLGFGGRASTERIRAYQDVYQVNPGLSRVLLQAMAFEKALSDMTIYIDENPIVGTLTEFRMGCNPTPEIGSDWIVKEIDTARPGHTGSIEVSDEDKRLIREAAKFWHDKNMEHKMREVFAQAFPGLDASGLNRVFSTTWQLVFCTAIVDHNKVVTRGLESIIQEAEDALARLDVERRTVAKRDFLNAVIIANKAVIKWARRYSALAREMAEAETDTQRKRELQTIAKACEWVPAKPARNFHEALQAFWFIIVTAGFFEAERVGASAGRVSQFLYPPYRKDKDAGLITDEAAIELLQFLWLKIQELQLFHSAEQFHKDQGTTANHWTLGGLTPDGEDATNEMDFLLLETQRRMKFVQPTLAVLVHNKMSEQFWHKCVDTVRDTGLGQPAFFSNDLCVSAMLRKFPGISMEEARGVAIIGCNENALPGKMFFMLHGTFNMAKLVELALNNGKDALNGKQVGPQTGDPEQFDSYEQLHKAVKKQLGYLLPLCVKMQRLHYDCRAELLPAPFMSSLMEGCIENGTDILSGGAKYNAGGAIIVGTVDLANSLAAVRKVVFEDKATTMKELVEALRVNFEGKEHIQKMLLDAPKYGNNDRYADDITKEWFDLAYQEHQKLSPYPTRTSGWFPESFSISSHFAFGLNTAALPSGRPAGIALTDATISAMPGTDKSGPTALMMSAARVLDPLKYASTHLNMKFHPLVLKGREGARKLVSLIKSYLALGGYHVQFNCVSDETLRDAQLHPENYRDLVVRVAGFSAYFIHLEKGVQDEIIKRSSLCC